MVFTTVNGAFDELLKRIELNPDRVQKVAGRYKSVKETLEAGIPGCEVFQIGSFQRKTKIRPDDENEGLDIDVGVCIKEFTEYASGGVIPSQALVKVDTAISENNNYAKMNLKKDMPTVALKYADGFLIEFVPCYKSVGRHYHRDSPPYCYIVGKDGSSWQPADYVYDATIISGLNQVPAVKQLLVPSIKMIKRYIRNLNLSLKSFHVEMLCALIIPNLIADWTNRNLRFGFHHILAFFLSGVYAFMQDSVSIPGSYSPAVDSGLSQLKLIELGLVLKRKGDNALKICEMTDEGEALGNWRIFFGEPFPA